MRLKWRSPTTTKKKEVTNKRLATILNEIEYKNWAFYLQTLPKNHLGIVAEFIVPDSSFEWHLNRPVSITTGMTISESIRLSDEEIVEHIWEMISKTEMHEAAEWFVYKGEKIYYPH